MSGYSLRSLVLAFLVVNHQLMGAAAALHSAITALMPTFSSVTSAFRGCTTPKPVDGSWT